MKVKNLVKIREHKIFNLQQKSGGLYPDRPEEFVKSPIKTDVSPYFKARLQVNISHRCYGSHRLSESAIP